MSKTFLNPEGHQNCISGSKVTAILLKEWIFPIGGASAVEGSVLQGGIKGFNVMGCEGRKELDRFEARKKTRKLRQF